MSPATMLAIGALALAIPVIVAITRSDRPGPASALRFGLGAAALILAGGLVAAIVIFGS